jgi:hypothetical protein
MLNNQFDYIYIYISKKKIKVDLFLPYKLILELFHEKKLDICDFVLNQ